MKEKKSNDFYIDIPHGVSKETLMPLVENAANTVGLYISHIGKYLAHKHPGSVHWHFKRDKNQKGILDATFYDIESLFWLMIAHRNPKWVHDKVPDLIQALEREFAAIDA
jgi:hypothetical protein